MKTIFNLKVNNGELNEASDEPITRLCVIVWLKFTY